MSSPTVSIYLEQPSTAGADNNYLEFDDATYGLFDTGEFAGQLGNQANKTTFARSFSTSRGSGNPNDLLFHATTGNANVSFNNLDKEFDPTVNTDIRPGQSFQIVANWASTDYTLFTGKVDNWSFDYPEFASAAVANCQAVDGMAALAAATVDERLPRGLTSSRIGKLLDRAAWPQALRTVSDGLTLMPTMERRSTSALAALFEAADSELGEFYVTGSNVATFRARTDPVEETRSAVSQATFGPSDLKYHDIEISYGADRIRNDITNEWSNGEDPARASDAASIQRYDRHEVSIRTSMVDQSIAEQLPTFFVDIYKNPAVRVEKIVIKPLRDPATLWPQVLGREIGDRITVELDVPGGGTITRDAWIRGVSHASSPGDWTTTFVLQDLSTYRTYIRFDTTDFDTDPHYFFF